MHDCDSIVVSFIMQPNEQQLRKKEDARQKAELNQRVAEENLKTRQVIAAETAAKRESIRKKELELYESHKGQIELARAKREETRKQVIADKSSVHQEDAAERETLRKYITSITEEPWMKNNPRAHSVDEYHKKAYEHGLFDMNFGPSKNSTKKSKAAV